MTLEIHDTTEFRDKLAHLIQGINELNASGVNPEAGFDQDLIDSFLNQFEETAPARAVPFRAGYIVVAEMTGYIPGYFDKTIFRSETEARYAIHQWVKDTGHGQESAYGVREVTYFA